jgi:hypothetical protein
MFGTGLKKSHSAAGRNGAMVSDHSGMLRAGGEILSFDKKATKAPQQD